MALIDLARTEMKVPGIKCAFGKWFDALPAQHKNPDVVTQAQVRELFDAPDLSNAAVARVIAKASRIHHDAEKVRRHKLGLCVDCLNAGRLS